MSENLDRNTENSDRETSEAVLPKGTTQETKPKKESNETKSKGELIKELVNKKFDEGFEVKEKNDRIKLNKQIQSDLKLKSGWSTDINKVILESMTQRKMKIDDLGFKNDTVGGMKINLISSTAKSETDSLETNITKNPIITHSALPKKEKGALPKEGSTEETQTRTQEGETDSEKKYMSATSQKKLISMGLVKFLLPVYKAVGICELDEKEIKEQSKTSTASQMEKDFEELAGDIDLYLVENNIKLPAFLNHIAIFVSIFVVLVLPAIKFKMFSAKKEVKPDYDDDAEKINIES